MIEAGLVFPNGRRLLRPAEERVSLWAGLPVHGGGQVGHLRLQLSGL